METVTIKINWNSEMSISLAEEAKKKLENAGWTLINDVGGMVESALVYANLRSAK